MLWVIVQTYTPRAQLTSFLKGWGLAFQGVKSFELWVIFFVLSVSQWTLKIGGQLVETTRIEPLMLVHSQNNDTDKNGRDIYAQSTSLHFFWGYTKILSLSRLSSFSWAKKVVMSLKSSRGKPVVIFGKRLVKRREKTSKNNTHLSNAKKHTQTIFLSSQLFKQQTFF